MQKASDHRVRMALAITAACDVNMANAGYIGTYVDATTSNTTPSSAFEMTTGSDYDNLWFVEARAGCGNGDVLASNAPVENSPMLTTAVSGVANGSYNVYVQYWVSSEVELGAAWNIQAAISGSPLVTYDMTSGRRRAMLSTARYISGRLCWAR